jgi:hypothetical protein
LVVALERKGEDGPPFPPTDREEKPDVRGLSAEELALNGEEGPLLEVEAFD